MIKKLVKHGNSRALVIDKGVLELLRIDDDTPLEITTNGNALIVIPQREYLLNEKLESALQEVNARYPEALKKLAE
ncbi:MAG: AbrB/MazE/SpoVT family DNA-binding domain-containing protein [bacterium]|nr:AbrB/MazE/SpoVT family DNA-binding domain-containing protein [bacterium]